MAANNPIEAFCKEKLLPFYEAHYQPEKRAAVQKANGQLYAMLALALVAPLLTGVFATPLLGFYLFVILLVITEVLYLMEIAKIYQKVNYRTVFFLLAVNALVAVVGYYNFSSATEVIDLLPFAKKDGKQTINPAAAGFLCLTVLSLVLTYQSDSFENFLSIGYEEFKNKAMSLFFQQFYPEFSMSAGAYFSGTMLAATELFDRIDEINERDIVHGKIDGRSAVFSEIELIRVTKTDKGTQRSTIFKGLMVEMQLPWAPANRVILKREPGWNPVNIFIENEDEVKMEDAEFEKRFQVLSSDKMEVYRILSPQAMQDLVQLNRRYPQMPGLCFSTNGSLYFALPMTDDLFEVDLANDTAGIYPRFAGIDGLMNQLITLSKDLSGLRRG